MAENIALLLSKCRQFRVKSEILIICDTDETFLRLLRGQHQLFKSLDGEAWEQINLRSESGEYKTILHHPRFRPPIVLKPMDSITSISETDIIGEIMKYPNPSSLVRMEDDKGIFANQYIIESSGTNTNNWLGSKMSSYWIPEELERYKLALLKNREVSNFVYTAYFFTGEKANFKVDAQLVKFNNDLCRWVRVLDCEVIS
jgi:hypothetical protein